MSNLDGLDDPAPVADTTTEIEDLAPSGGETPEIEAIPDETPPEPPDYLNIDDDLGNKHVKLTVDGEEIDVPLREALSGYSRQADYTRKTQELAEQRRQAEEAMRVYEAMQASPGLTVQVLANRAGMSVEDYLGLTPSQQQAAVESNEPSDDEYMDPLEKELHDTRRMVDEMRRQMADEQADRKLREVTDGIKQTYGVDDKAVNAAVMQTHQMGLGISAVPLVFRAMEFERLRVQQQTVQEAETQREQQTRQRQAAAAAATNSVSTGGSSAGVTPQAPQQQPTSIRDAVELAFEEVEGRALRR